MEFDESLRECLDAAALQSRELARRAPGVPTDRQRARAIISCLTQSCGGAGGWMMRCATERELQGLRPVNAGDAKEKTMNFAVRASGVLLASLMIVSCGGGDPEAGTPPFGPNSEAGATGGVAPAPAASSASAPS